MPDHPSNSGIVTDETGVRHIPESVRADGSVRKAIKIRPGYKPAEDVQVYKNRTAETFRNRYKGGVIGAESADSTGTAATSTSSTTGPSSAAANKNAKRREARKKAKAAGEAGETTTTATTTTAQASSEDWEASAKKLATEPPAHLFEEGRDASSSSSAEAADAERKKKARNLTKKLKQARDLKNKSEDGQSLLPEQLAKVIKMNELIRELAALGFDAEGEPVEEGTNGEKAEEEKAPA